MDRRNDESGWNIPKKKNPKSTQGASSMNMTIPKKRPSQGSSSSSSLTGSIPRKGPSNALPPPPIPRKSSSGVIPRKSSSSSSVPRKSSFSDGGSIPRRPSHGNGGSTHSSRGSYDSGGGSIPKRPSHDASRGSIPRRPSYDNNNSSIPKKHHASSSSHSIPRKTDKIPKKSSSIPLHKSSSSSHGFDNPSRHPPPQRTKRPSRSGWENFIVTERPLVIRIPLKGVSMIEGIPPPMSQDGGIGRKRKSVSYQELDDTDSDDYMTEEEERRLKAKKIRLSKKTTANPQSNDASGEKATGTDVDDTVSAAAVAPAPVAVDDSNISNSDFWALNNSLSVDAPPPGTLNTLWYSRECFGHVLVVEKILAWKMRPVSKLEWVPETLTPKEEGYIQPRPAIDTALAAKLSNMALTNPVITSDANKRMEVSRLAPAECPIVMTMAVSTQDDEEKPEQKEGDDEGDTTKPEPKYRIKALQEKDREEVYLVKWRGRSHLHASWERGSDIIKYDQSKNTARHKIRRFVQSQELMYGKNWRKVLEEERSTAATIHAHGLQDGTVDKETVDEDYYPPACTEVERILACDESEMDMNLFAKQRARNILRDQQILKEKESNTTKRWNSKEGLAGLLKEIPWDPEDNVRYVVKWKTLPFSEVTWEYWRDIKRDAVDEAEDFWTRQKPPEQNVIDRNNRSHPHIRDFRKMQESPVYGLSKRKRHIADLGQDKEEDGDDVKQGFRLRSYQLEGVNWLLFNWWNKRSCILADEMGLGKTIQSMCFLRSLQDDPTTGVRGPFLVVAPLSLIGQWQSEAKTWAPDLNVVLYHGSADARDFLVKQEFYYTDQFVPKATAIKLKKQHVTKFHILITTYEVAMKDTNILSKIRWRALVVDEAHRLKNPKSRLFADLAAFPRDYCLLLTGTPLANATEELWALLHFADNSAFKSKDDFLDKFGQLTDADQVKELHTVLKPYLLRRMKEDVEKSLPPKEETILEVSLTPVQKKFYKAIYERNTTFLFKGSKPSNAPSLMNVMMELRKCCNHPYLIRGAEDRILTDAALEKRALEPAVPPDPVALFGEQLIKSSGKMVLISKLLPKLLANGHKVLIFSQMVRVLDLLEEVMKLMKYKYERLDGSTSSSSRAAAVDRFVRKSCQRFVMLLSTRAGGLGLNLTAADTVIIFDSDWNPQNDLQAMARAHRIGQTRAVRVYRLLTAKTYEMHMFHSASMKLGLERAVLSQQRDQGEGEQDEGGQPKSTAKSDREAQAKEIDSLLKKGAYDVFKDDNDEEAKQFMETDIDQLLEKSATTVTYGPNQTNLSNGLGSFSKASFVADTGDGEKDVDLDDPDFWQKAVGLEKPVETTEEVAQMLDDGVKRSRKQVQVYDPYAEIAEMEQRKIEEEKLRKEEEKEERERARKEKKKRKQVEKEQKKKEREEAREQKVDAKTAEKELEKEAIQKKQSKDAKPKKAKKIPDKSRLSKRLELDNPDYSLKQGWDVPQRNRAVAAFLRFGFSRFCRIRSESNLTSLPIHDFEVFCRSYFFQLSLQAAVPIMQMLKDESAMLKERSVKDLIHEFLGTTFSHKEADWICDCLSNGMRSFLDVERNRKFLRLPKTLAEPSFVEELRRGSALRSLRRMFLLCRVQRIIEDCSDKVIGKLGHEQLAQRGCQTFSLSTLDSDLKARLVSTEELALTLGLYLQGMEGTSPVAWWDRSCDIALLIGTFVHGLGNYDSMLSDSSLPFGFRIKKYAKIDEACVAAQKRFEDATDAARQVFDESLEAFDLREEKKNLAIISAAAANQTALEKDAQALREGGAAADAVLSKMPDQARGNRYEIVNGDDGHFVTLKKLREKMRSVIRKCDSDSDASAKDVNPSASEGKVENSGTTGSDAKSRRTQIRHALLMPDARVLSHRLQQLVEQVETTMYNDNERAMQVDRQPSTASIWPSSEAASASREIKSRSFSLVFGVDSPSNNENDVFTGVGTSGSQCAVSHRSLNDGTDYCNGAASSELAHVACGTSRYLRAIGVPINFTRFAVSALIHADGHCVQKVIESERARSKTDSSAEVKHSKNAPNGTEAKGEKVSDNGVAADDKGLAGSELEQKLKVDEMDIDGFEAPKDDMKNGHKDNGSSVNDTPVNPLVSKSFTANAKLRASVCSVVLHFGFFHSDNDNSKVERLLWNSIREHCGEFDENDPAPLFSGEHFRKRVIELLDDDQVPSVNELKEYIESCLLPHCLRLCLMGNGPYSTGARGSNGKYGTAQGTSLYPEYSENLQSPLPDPCLELKEQSIEALGVAYAILRRVQMMRSAFAVASGKISFAKIDDILHSSFMRKSMNGLPVWWCPWIHDAALLVHASSRGLFSILQDRHSKTQTSAFSVKTIRQHMYSVFVAESALPSSILEESPPEDSTSWIELQSKEFPSMHVLEQRLAFLCAEASATLDADEVYDCLPMFDHGSWPRLS
ncbi:unnamed protein product [Cylindrotheca closterium]|uniref:Uncharacterized protein n=1 Tax=Cylindrotheca closterium TaxID=2856 RepID=A0AAD2JHQ6_9STRA|nr:unnamed protein product [Cylindrotheca closterium]